MQTKELFTQSLVRKAAQAIVHRELYGWPPDTIWSAFQPRRPEKNTLQPQQKR